jgi:UDP-2,3-diacylglucosamine pyrophosphatase LpxH
MKLPAIIVSDPHFTASPNDEYRWGLWPWLAEEIKAEKARTLLILGDLTDAKDYHPAELVNRLTAAIAAVPVDEVIILAGNHDWLKQGGVFFKFLEKLQKPRVRVITEPTEDLGTDDADPACMFLPYTKNPARDWKDKDFSHYHFLFMHQTAPGSIASNGQKMEGEEMPPLNAEKVYSGDIHVPQKIGAIEYVGSPYHVHFGDAFKPRCLVINRYRKAYDLHFPTISRVAVKISAMEELDEMGIKADDQVKVTFVLDEADAHRWSTIRRRVSEDIRGRKAHLHGIKMIVQKHGERLGEQRTPARRAPEPADAVYRFVIGQELGGDALDIGLEIIEQ